MKQGMLLAVWFLCVACTFRVESGTRRIWIGNDLYDWIDVGTIQRLVNGESIILYHDPTPIQAAWITDRLTCSFLVSQQEATWLVESASGRSAEYTVTNITNVQRELLMDYSQQIYSIKEKE